MNVLPLAKTTFPAHITYAYLFPPFDLTTSQDIIYDPNSPILDFYQLDFKLHLNGEKQCWEALDENSPLKAIACTMRAFTYGDI